ncbi:MAG: diguanylate cyclase [Thermodesulfobacteriota bacterium]
MTENGTSVLIVDDDAALLDSLNDFLEISGFKTKIANTAEEALEILKNKEFQIVIVDIVLPGLGGLDLTDIIKKNYNADVILMTGHHVENSYENAIKKGASDFVFKPFRFEEIMLRIRRVLREREVTNERNRMLEKLKKLATIDGLTKLYNSRHFYNQLQLEVDRTIRYNHKLSLLLLDIDNFKLFNDSFGHLEGDKVLRRIGEIIKSCLRKMDSAYRYGGEEFTILLPETNATEAMVVAQRIRSAIESEFFVSSQKESGLVTVSIGVSEYLPKEKISNFIRRSDSAMYDSKRSGRNMVSLILPES